MSLVESQMVQDALARWHVVATPEDEAEYRSLAVMADELGQRGPDPKWVMSFDGSPYEDTAREAFPSTMVGYLQIAGVLVHLEEMLGQGGLRFVDPAVVRDATEESLLSVVLPSANVRRRDMAGLKDSWRCEIFDVFSQFKVEDDSLLHAFRSVAEFGDRLSPEGHVVMKACPATDGCLASDVQIAFDGSSRCPACEQRLFPTDALRIHEEVWEEGSNLTSLGRLMSVLEHLSMAAYLLYFLRRQPRALGDVAVVMDGPLAVFGPSAWLHTGLERLIARARGKLAEGGWGEPVIVGIEKSGAFADHLRAIEQNLPQGTLVALPDAYMYRYILASRPAKSAEFGRDTYYGQKFFYKTQQGKALTISVPRAQPWNGELGSLAATCPSLARTTALLDRIGTMLYENAVIPVALAHSFASIPLRTGSRVLSLLTRQRLNFEA